MRNRVAYEWLVEQLDASGDILDVSHPATAAEAIAHFGPGYRIGLVRDLGNDVDGVVERLWAYAGNDGHLPLGFEDSTGEQAGVKVPRRYDTEWRAARGLAKAKGQL